MFSGALTKKDFNQIFENFKEHLSQTSHFDIVVENYLPLVNQLQTDLSSLRDELAYYKKVHGDITDSLDEFITIQRLSSIITENLEYQQIVENLDNISQKVFPHLCSQLFITDQEPILAVTERQNIDFEVILKNMQEEGILDWLWEQAQPIVIPLGDFILPGKLNRDSGTLVIAPMRQGQKGLGVYLIYTDKDQEQFSIRDLELLNILTQQAGIAIQYTRLFKKLNQTHDALKKSQAKLMQTVKMATIGELAGGIAHEINNPLQIILGNIQIAMMGYKFEDSLKVIESQAMRIANIVRGLLSMARQNTTTKSEFIELNPLIMNTLNLVRGQIEKRGIKFEIKLNENLPMVQGSSVYFQQILLNFILHSKQQINQGGTIIIRSYQKEDDFIRIEIEDSGIPMPEEYIQKILDPFADIDNVSEMNLGLAVSVQMIRDIGGEVQINSGKDFGNRIKIKIRKCNPAEVKYDKDNTSIA
jgi:signal transduction histidine kinase